MRRDRDHGFTHRKHSGPISPARVEHSADETIAKEVVIISEEAPAETVATAESRQRQEAIAAAQLLAPITEEAGDDEKNEGIHTETGDSE